MSTSETTTDAARLNRSVERACSVLSCFTLSEPRLTLLELARRTGLPKPTVHRLATTLQVAGFMSQAEDGRYGLGFKLLELGAVVRDHLDIVATCAPAMRSVAGATGESVLLGRADWDVNEVVIVQRIDSSHSLSVLSPIGRRSPIPPGCLGKALLMGLDPAQAQATLEQMELVRLTPKTHTDKPALLAELEQARAVGYAVEEDEFLEDVSGVAVPVVFDGGRPLGALAVVGPSTRMHGELVRIGELLRGAAAPL